MILSVLLLIAASCGTVQRGSVPANGNRGSERIDNTPAAISVSGMNRVIQQLHGAHNEWQGTPYRLGGNGMNGIDCSAFTQIVFRDFFSQNIPRNTREQLQVGNGVRKSSIRPGDLIFFRTGRSVLHVGIAMDDGNFLHASVSNGVMISNLSESYWAGRYLGARRLL